MWSAKTSSCVRRITYNTKWKVSPLIMVSSIFFTLKFFEIIHCRYVIYFVAYYSVTVGLCVFPRMTLPWYKAWVLDKVLFK